MAWTYLERQEAEGGARPLCNCPNGDQQKEIQDENIDHLFSVVMRMSSTEMSAVMRVEKLQFMMEQRKIIIIQDMGCYTKGW